MHIYCSGIGGIGLSAYAALRAAEGHQVSGSDRSASVVTDDLIARGVAVFFEQDGSHIPADSDLFVYSEAVPPDAPERICAGEKGIRSVSYFEALGELSREYTTVIAICGSHGKSSTTAMAAMMLTDCNKDPTVIVGTRVPQLENRNWRRGTKELLMIEACEYRCSFLNFYPQIVLMTNVDWDHIDAFPSATTYEEAYVRFLKQLSPGGMVITHGRDPLCRRVTEQSGQRIIDADTEPMVSLQVPGEHMKENAQLVLALSRALGIAEEKARSSLKKYRGCWRRMELKGYYMCHSERSRRMNTVSHFDYAQCDTAIPIIDDYAHHPTEIRVTLKALKEAYPGKRLVCVFQPHMHNRTREFYDDFCTAFRDADVLIITDVYDARSAVEKEQINIQQLAEDTGATYSGDLKTTETYVRSFVKEGDVLVCMGAGDITNLATTLVPYTPPVSATKPLPSLRG